MPTAVTRRAPRAPEPAGPRELRIDVADHFNWARGIARGVRADHHFAKGSVEEMELEGTALLELAKRMAGFDESRLKPGDDLFGAFRGYASPWIRGECRRAAQRMRRHGLFGVGAAEVRVEALPTSEDGSEVTLADRDDEYEEPWSVWDTSVEE